MPTYVKSSTSWNKTAPWGKSSGTWNKAKEAYVKVAGTWKQWWLDGGLNDTTFIPGVAPGANVRSFDIQSDGKILVGYYGNVVRLNSDGTLDTAFATNIGTGFNGDVKAVALQSDGKIVVGGQFTTFNGATVNRIVCLNADGTRDTAFTTNTGTAFDRGVFAIGIQSDGKIICLGDFDKFNGIFTRIVRLNSNGTLDTAFNTNVGTGPNKSSDSIAIQSDGKIVIGGYFDYFNGVLARGIIRLNSDGTRDTAFSTNVGAGFLYDASGQLAIQPNGKIIVSGGFITFNGDTSVKRIVRLNSDGTRDTAFSTNVGTSADNSVYGVALQSDGKIVLGGYFTTFNGATVNYIVRLNSDGTRDTAFTTNTGTAFDNGIIRLKIQSDGKIICGGQFATFKGASAIKIIRIGGE